MNRERHGKRGGFPVIAFVLLAFLAAASCKWGVPSYTLNVTLAEGVKGTPGAGKHVYKELTTVTLSYSPENSVESVECWLNGDTRKAPDGSVVLYGDGYELTANLIDVRGSYEITLSYTDASMTAPDPFIITLTGSDRLAGTFTDARGYHGTWTALAGTLTLAYWDWGLYLLAADVYDFGYSSGTFTGLGLSGTWTSEKQ
jgi:hypothetical protein